MFNPEPLPKQHRMEDLFPGKVVKINKSSKDKDPNELIREEGAHLDIRPGESNGSRNEAEWYRKNKGYSVRT